MRSVPLAALIALAVFLAACREDTAWIDQPLNFGAEAVTVTVERGMSASEIGQALVRSGVFENLGRYRSVLRMTGGAERLRAGIYHIAPSMTARQVIGLLQSARGGGVRVTLVEGWTTAQMASRFVTAGLVSSERAFVEAVRRNPARAAWASGEASPEGFLFPDTYYFLPGQSADEIVAEMVDAFAGAVSLEAYAASVEAQGLSLREAVILASIVEREARGDEERPEVAGVFFNRLRRGMKLESCATVNYILGDWSRSLRIADTEIDHPYNTYRHAGLPPGPICHPGLSSLLAVAEPATTENLFFVYDPAQGRHVFTRTYAEHQRATREASGR
ncbi:MAG: endolytic transglycosylase MltG [Candidatus Sumerlaeia bacterium]|nr:endolytic transglycosylase MltG [Candidatus Sumerlaeia bacterium]